MPFLPAPKGMYIPAVAVRKMKAIAQEVAGDTNHEYDWLFPYVDTLSEFIYWKLSHDGPIKYQFRFDNVQQWSDWLSDICEAMHHGRFTRTIIDRRRI